jgi:hypothetical protein
MPLNDKALAPHPPSPSPRKFGLRLISMASRSGPNLRGEGGPDRTDRRHTNPHNKHKKISEPGNEKSQSLNLL